MNRTEIKTATRDELADELAAAGEFTGDWETADMTDLRERVTKLNAQFWPAWTLSITNNARTTAHTASHYSREQAADGAESFLRVNYRDSEGLDAAIADLRTSNRCDIGDHTITIEEAPDA